MVDSIPLKHLPQETGWIEVITGCMFSGKTEELIRRLVRARYAKQKVVVFKPATDTRYAEEDKARTGLGAGADAWAVPYWWVDGGMAAMTLLLAAEVEVVRARMVFISR